MLQQATNRLHTFVEWLDPFEDGKFRDQVINLYHNIATDNAKDAFERHPWKGVVIDEDGLRAEALGGAALKTALNDAAEHKSSQSRWYSVADRVKQLYQRRWYAACA